MFVKEELLQFKRSSFVVKRPQDFVHCSNIASLLFVRSRKTKKPTASPVKEDKPKLTIFDEDPDSDGLFGLAKDFSFTDSKRRLTAKESKCICIQCVTRM